MALQTPRRRAGVTIGLVVGIVAIFVGAWALERWRPFGSGREATSWPDNIEDLAHYVERTTGISFDDPVEIEFIPDADEFASRVESSWDEADPRAATWADEDEAFGRALGLWAVDIDLYERLQELDNPEVSPAWWVFDDEVLVVNAGGETSLDVGTRVAIVSALTEALLDQRYDLQGRARHAPLPQEWQVVVAMDGGHANWVVQEYVATLDRDEVEELDSGGDRTSTGAINRLPAAYRTLRSAAPQAGTAFFEALHEEAHGVVDDAYTDEWPDALDQIALPNGKYFTRDPLEQVDAPRTPEGGEFLRARQLGPVTLFLMMASVGDPQDALTASDGWGNDATTMYRLDDRICADSHIVADSPDDAELLEYGMNAWAYERPDETDVLVGRDGVDLFVSVCDPGTDIHQRTPSSTTGDQYLGRLQMIQRLTALTGNVATAECAAVELFAEYRASEALEMLDFDFDGILQTTLEDCVESS